MGRIIVERVKGMTLKAKISLVLIFTVAFSIFMYQGTYKPEQAQAAISKQANWTRQYAHTSYPNGAINANYTIGAGSQRLLVVAIASTARAVGTQTVSVTYGGQNLQLANGDAATNNNWKPHLSVLP